MSYKMKDMVKQINVSNTTLKRYEKMDLLPTIPYTDGGQRRYEDIHLLAFQTIRLLLQGFDIPIAYELMRLAKKKEFNRCFWMIAGEQKNLVEESEAFERNRQFILAMPDSSIQEKYMRIGELAQHINSKTSTIRYWEERGLIQSTRDQTNGYRYFDENEIRKTIMIASLRKTIYSIEEIEQIIDIKDGDSIAKLRKHLDETREKINSNLEHQLKAVASFMKYSSELS